MKGTTNAFLTTALLAGLLTTASAQAQQPMLPVVCMTFEAFRSISNGVRGEVEAARGSVQDGKFLAQVWVSEDGKFTFTLSPAGTNIICAVLDGTDFETITPKWGEGA